MRFITKDGNNFVKAVHLYDRVFFGNIATKYICWYADTRYLNCTDEPDMNAHCIFEKTINPDLDPGWYVCVKCGDEYRANLAE